jgi:hypothetical protein
LFTGLECGLPLIPGPASLLAQVVTTAAVPYAFWLCPKSPILSREVLVFAKVQTRSAVRFARRSCAAQAVPRAARFPEATPSVGDPYVVDPAFVRATGVSASDGTGISVGDGSGAWVGAARSCYRAGPDERQRDGT